MERGFASRDNGVKWKWKMNQLLLVDDMPRLSDELKILSSLSGKV